MNLCFFTLNFFVKNKNVLTPSITVKVVHSRLQLIFLYLTECQIQTLKKKKKKCKSFTRFHIPCCHVLCLRNICFDFLYFSFLMIWRYLKELQLALVIFSLQQKTSNKTNIHFTSTRG